MYKNIGLLGAAKRVFIRATKRSLSCSLLNPCAWKRASFLERIFHAWKDGASLLKILLLRCFQICQAGMMKISIKNGHVALSSSTNSTYLQLMTKLSYRYWIHFDLHIGGFYPPDHIIGNWISSLMILYRFSLIMNELHTV